MKEVVLSVYVWVDGDMDCGVACVYASMLQAPRMLATWWGEHLLTSFGSCLEAGRQTGRGLKP